jgi:energy-coupling factor transporter ATP-binding protein EcfA2
VPEEWKHLLTAFVLLSYEQAKISTVPYFAFVGDNESGKSTALELLKRLCYRPLWGTTIPAADIYGYLADEDVQGVILEDEAQGLDRDFDKVKIYKSGYKKGSKVPRTTITDSGRKIEYFNTFCLKAIAAESAPSNKGLRERFLICEMVNATPKKSFVHITPEEEKRFQDLRNKLLKYKLKHATEPLQDFNVEFLSGRLEELLLPLLRVTYGLKAYDIILEFCKQLVEKKEREGKETLEGTIVKVVAEIMIEELSNEIKFDKIWSYLREELEITDVNEQAINFNSNSFETLEFGTITKQYIGRRISDIFGAKKILVRNTRGYQFNPRTVVALCSKYRYRDLKEELIKKFNLEVEKQKHNGVINDINDINDISSLRERNLIVSSESQIKNAEKTPEISEISKMEEEKNNETLTPTSKISLISLRSLSTLDNKVIEEESEVKNDSELYDLDKLNTLIKADNDNLVLCERCYLKLPTEERENYEFINEEVFCSVCGKYGAYILKNKKEWVLENLFWFQIPPKIKKWIKEGILPLPPQLLKIPEVKE